MKQNIILSLLLMLFLVACKKYEAQYGIESATTTDLKDGVYEIAYSTEDGIFLLTTRLDRAKMLVSFAGQSSAKAVRVAFSSKKDKIAYVHPSSGIPIIVDTSGNVLQELTQYTNVNDLGWHNGDSTLYLLANNQIYFYGESLDLPKTVFPVYPGSFNYEVKTLDINDDLDIAYGAVYYMFSNNKRYWYYTSEVDYKLPSLADQVTTKLYTSYNYLQSVLADTKRYYHTLRFSNYQGGEEVQSGRVDEGQSSAQFGGYELRKQRFALDISEDGRLLKRGPDDYPASSWDIDTDEDPLYVDWAIGF